MPVTPEEEFDYWDAKATELRREQLASVRATATKWTALMSALLGVFGTVAFAGGLQTVDHLSDPWASIVKGLTTGAAVSAVGAIVLLSLAAGGLRISKEKGLTADSVRRMSTEDTRQALHWLSWGKVATVIAATLVLTGSTIILWVQPKSTPPQTVLVITRHGVFCGPLTRAKGEFHVGRHALEGDISGTIIVDACPASSAPDASMR
jgi:hypothetical protein